MLISCYAYALLLIFRLLSPFLRYAASLDAAPAAAAHAPRAACVMAWRACCAADGARAVQ